ncbi:MAG: outer membrane protein assembly factor BamC [Advenella sp.]
MRMNARFLAVSGLLSLTLLAGCNVMDEVMGDTEQVDYKSTVRGDPLSLPPDLSASQINPAYKPPGGYASANEYNKAVAQANRNAASGASVLPETAGLKIQSSGANRWLEVSQEAGRVYPKLIDFWVDSGFTINRDNPQAGLIETDWAENRAKIPGNLLNRALGAIINMVEDSGERERFRTRLERSNGKTLVFISHERMVETPMDRDGTSFKWLPAKEDPGLNAAMLSRLMVFLGATKQQAEAQVRQTAAAAAAPTHPVVMADVAALPLQVGQSQAYTQVGAAINSAGFTVDNRDPQAGTYTVRYLDTDTGEKRQSSNFISRLWGDKGNLTPLPYTIAVTSEANQSVVTVRNEQGQADNSATARRILTVLAERM